MSARFVVGILLAIPLGGHAQGCSVNSGALQFGAYDASRPTPTDSRADLVVRCAAGDATHPAASALRIRLEQPSAATSRSLQAGTAHLAYTIFQDAAHRQPWADDGSGGRSLDVPLQPTTDAGAEAHMPAWGRIAPHQWVPAASYVDVVTVSVEY